MRRISKNDPDGPVTIGFRLNGEYRDVLKMRASIFGRSEHDLARQYMVEAMMSATSQEDIYKEIEALKYELRVLREDFTLAVQCLLVSAGRINPEHAEAWVAEHLRRGVE